MKLAEALIIRADAQKRLAQLRDRLTRSAKVQEGDTPPETPQELLQEASRILIDFTDIVQRINRTNAATPFGDGKTLTDVLAERDALGIERNFLTLLIEKSAPPDFRRGRSEIKFVPTINVRELQGQIDALSRRYRELDTAIQSFNWTVDLL